MESADVFRSLLQNLQELRFHSSEGFFDFGFRNRQIFQVRRVKLPCIFQDRGIAPAADIRKNVRHDFFYIDCRGYPGKNLSVGYFPVFINSDHAFFSNCISRLSRTAQMAASLN